eukprot:5203503-Pleurochrysis_carterae.AAC.1
MARGLGVCDFFRGAATRSICPSSNHPPLRDLAIAYCEQRCLVCETTAMPKNTNRTSATPWAWCVDSTRAGLSKVYYSIESTTCMYTRPKMENRLSINRMAEHSAEKRGTTRKYTGSYAVNYNSTAKGASA